MTLTVYQSKWQSVKGLSKKSRRNIVIEIALNWLHTLLIPDFHVVINNDEYYECQQEIDEIEKEIDDGKS